MKHMMSLMLVIITVGVVLSCESLFNDQMDALQSNYFHGTKQFFDANGAGNDLFGYSVSVSADGSTVAVGVIQDDIIGVSNQGSTWVYRWDGSSWVEKIITVDGVESEFFGCSVSVSADGNTVVAGAFANGSYKGAAYVYRWNGSSWAKSIITASGTSSDGRFGMSVAVSGDGNTIVVGVPRDDNTYTDQGSAYIYRWNGSAYVQMQKIEASLPCEFSYFGSSVAISGNGYTVVVGVPDDNITESTQGSAYIYRWNGSSWVETERIEADTGISGAHFGNSVAVSNDGNTVVAGAPGDLGNAGVYSGALYVYRWDGSSWSEEKIITGDGSMSDKFGFSVAISGDGTVVLAGATEDDIAPHNNQGSAYVYHWNGSSYALTRKITVSDGAANDYFGNSVAISADGCTCVVGVSKDTIQSIYQQGSVWLYAE